MIKPSAGGFDFEVYYKNELIGKFQDCTFSFQQNNLTLPTLNWVLKQGVIDTKIFQTEFDLAFLEGEHEITSDNQIEIRFEGKKENKEGHYCCITEMSNIKLGKMPGRRVAVVNLTGKSDAINFVAN